MPLTTADLQKNIWRNTIENNELVFALNQPKTPPLEQPGPWGRLIDRDPKTGEITSSGYCLGLSLLWLAERKKGSNFEYDESTMICNYPGWIATLIQSRYNTDPKERVTVNSLGYSMEYCKYMAYQFLNLNILYIEGEKNLSADNFFSAMNRSAKQYYQITLNGKKNAHALAMEKVGESYGFFDPNYGHFQFHSFTRAKEWIGSFLWESNYLSQFDTIKLIHIMP